AENFMRNRHSRAFATLAAITAAGLAGYSLWPPHNSTPKTLAARNPAVEVRTQVVRRTIHVARAGAGHASQSGSARYGRRGAAVSGQRGGHIATGASGS